MVSKWCAKGETPLKPLEGLSGRPSPLNAAHPFATAPSRGYRNVDHCEGGVPGDQTFLATPLKDRSLLDFSRARNWGFFSTAFGLRNRESFLGGWVRDRRVNFAYAVADFEPLTYGGLRG